MTIEILHVPVMMEEVLNFLKVAPGGRYIDCTLGDGGHSEMILERSSPTGQVLGIDRDAEAVRAGTQRLARYQPRIKIQQKDFSQVKTVVNHFFAAKKVDGILIDLGVSTRQLVSPKRGFGFSFDGPLDMRMDQSGGESALDLVNRLSKKELMAILKNYGEERRWAGRISTSIIRKRETQPITTTKQLAGIIVNSIPVKYRKQKTHPATKTFQALRIEINEELEMLKKTLPEVTDLLKAGGRLAVISFHSLEDRIVKQFFAKREKGCICPPETLYCHCGIKPGLKRITKKPVCPGAEEIKRNPRSRSAKLRVAEKLPAR